MVNTVTGKVSKDSLGIVLPHEHILIDMRGVIDSQSHTDYTQPLSAKNRYKVWSDPYYLEDNAFYLDEGTALAELMLYSAAGGNTIVDATLDGIGRNPLALKRLSEASGLNIIMGCGFYTEGAHPDRIKHLSAKELAGELITEIAQGFGDTGIKPGIIGEIGTSPAVTDNEWKVVDAAGIASLETGLPIHFHTGLWERNGLPICHRLIAAGVQPQSVCINHIDVDLRQDYMEQLLDLGVYIEFDNFGKEFFMPPRANGWLRGRFAYDMERCVSIKKLIRAGYCDRILITNDLCLKSMLTTYGGNGFAHILNNIVPMLAYAGVGDRDIKRIIEDNPAEFIHAGK